MAGLAVFTHKTTGALVKRGLHLFTYFLTSEMRSTQKVPGAPARSQGNFPIALKVSKKMFLIGFINHRQIKANRNSAIAAKV
jgi:hypothetical protein